MKQQEAQNWAVTNSLWHFSSHTVCEILGHTHISQISADDDAAINRCMSFDTLADIDYGMLSHTWADTDAAINRCLSLVTWLTPTLP